MDKTAAIVVIGDEILSGKYGDENARFAITELRGLGVALRRVEIIPDDIADIADTVSDMSRRFDLVVTSGGVGPTHDDMTMAGIARAFGVPLIRHPRFVELLRTYYGDDLQDSHYRLAEMPEGAELIDAPGLTAPIVRARNVYILPGVPSLFRKKLLALADRFRAPPFLIGRVYLAVDETAIADRLSAIARAHPTVAFGSYPRFDKAEFHVILTAEAKDREAVASALADLASVLGDLVHKIESPA